jgi:hypothetical protein
MQEPDQQHDDVSHEGREHFLSIKREDFEAMSAGSRIGLPEIIPIVAMLHDQAIRDHALWREMDANPNRAVPQQAQVPVVQDEEYPELRLSMSDVRALLTLNRLGISTTDILALLYIDQRELNRQEAETARTNPGLPVPHQFVRLGEMNPATFFSRLGVRPGITIRVHAGTAQEEPAQNAQNHRRPGQGGCAIL